MKVIEIQEQFGLDALATASRTSSEPARRQVKVRVEAVSLNYRDLMMIKGQYNPRQPLPLVPCSDGAGEVVAVGEDVQRVKRGDRVAGIFAQRWLGGQPPDEAKYSTLGGPLDGMAAEEVVLDEDGVVPIPGHLDCVQAATLPCAAVTAWNAVVEQGQVRAGDTVLVLGTGGVSVFALQFARAAGARVIATSSSDAKLKRAIDLGAAEGINYRETPDWHKRVLELTDGRGVDQVVEVGGAGTLQKSVHAVRAGGMISVIGVLAGVNSELDVRPVLMKGVRLHGVFVGSREMFTAMNRAIELHAIEPVIDSRFGFDEFKAAFEYMESGAHFGKIVVTL